MENQLTVLNKVLPTVVRVHGSEHPELKEVKVVYEELVTALEQKADPKPTMAKLKALTNDFTLPTDACDAYRKVYQAFKELENLI